MARTIRDANLETKAARRRLSPRAKPYFRTLEPGLHLGYRRLTKGTGKWIARHYIGKQKYTVEVIATADDFSNADGVAILDYSQAQKLARARMVARAQTAAGVSGPITVAGAVAEYLEFLEVSRKSAADARYRAEAFILPALGCCEVAKLTTDQLRRWHAGLARAPARVRTKKGSEQRYKQAADEGESLRRRKSTANRILTVLKAALNRQWRDEKVPSDRAWRRVEPFEDVDAARIRYLSVEEAQRLIEAATPDIRKLIIAGLQTGARYGELIRLLVSDFNDDVGTLTIAQSKSSTRHVILTDEGIAFFRMVTTGRFGRERMFLKADGSIWKVAHQLRPMLASCAGAGITPHVGFHALRHTWASLAVMANVPLIVVARNLGHSDTRMVERHYGHLAPSYIADAIRAGAPRFAKAKNIVGLR